MQISYKNPGLDRVVIAGNVVAGGLVLATFVSLFGFYSPLADPRILFAVQGALLGYFLVEKAVRAINARSLKEYWQANWFELPLILLAILLYMVAKGRGQGPERAWHFAVGLYLILQIIAKSSRTMINLLAIGQDPMRVLIASFLLLILAGAGLLYLPRSTVNRANISIVDALFTATSAACVTGLTVKDIGSEFTLMGQIVILLLIQLGGLGIVIFGAVFAMLLGQALSIKESAAMQDLLSSRALNKIPHLITFIFVVTIIIEAIGAICLTGLWPNDPRWRGGRPDIWFYSLFHAISAFCNAGLGLWPDSMAAYRRCWQLYLVMCPLVILGGFGFGVLYDLGQFIIFRVTHLAKRVLGLQTSLLIGPVKRFSLQTKLVLAVSAILLAAGTIGLLVFERYTAPNVSGAARGLPEAFFHSVMARTAGFTTVNMAQLSDSSKFVLILLMIIGGSPGGTAGGVKTATMVVVALAVLTTLQRQRELHVFGRSISPGLVSRSLAVITVYGLVLFVGLLGLTITERSKQIDFLDLTFEATSALGTVGFSTGLTGSLSTCGKLILMILMLIGRLGPLSLATALTFAERRPHYSYPVEQIVVG
ncbi:MAG: potassium transporter TrkG [Sedimentisphaerales bacterium]|nr:potassium transporter TrkG [Sedimentisphaerales bacterium]